MLLSLLGALAIARIVDASITLAKMSDSTITTASNTQTFTNKSLAVGQLTGVLPIANGGTNNSSAYTSGSVIYSNGTSMTQNNADLFYNSTGLGVGTNAPSAKIHIVQNTASDSFELMILLMIPHRLLLIQVEMLVLVYQLLQVKYILRMQLDQLLLLNHQT